jgi:hypothetical protein
MATEDQVQCRSYLAAGDLSAAQYLCMKISAANTVTTTTGVTDVAVGILQNDPAAAGRAATVAYAGRAKGKLGATVAAGAKVAPMANGRLQTAVSTQSAIGICVNGGVDGDITEIDMNAPPLLA